MSSKMGITTDPDAKRAHWESRVVGFRGWRLLRTFGTKPGAQKFAAQYAEKYGCRVSSVDTNVEGTWYVYRFNYNKIRTEAFSADSITSIPQVNEHKDSSEQILALTS